MIAGIHAGHIVFAAFVLSLIFAVMFFTGLTVNKAPRSYNRAIFKHYVLGSTIMNESERQLYFALLRKFGRSFHVCPKVRVEDVIQVNNKKRPFKERNALRSRIKSRHFDALVTDPRGRPVAAFEFDGPTHFLTGPKFSDSIFKRLYRYVTGFGAVRAARGADKFKNELCSSVGLPLYRISYKEEIQSQLNDIRLR